MRKSVWAYSGVLLAFLIFDGLWLGVLMSSTYKELFGPLMLASPNWGPAAVFYLLYVAGVVFLLGLSIWKITLPVLFSASKKDMLQRLHDTETYATYRIVQQSQKAR